MALSKGTSADYLSILADLQTFITSDHVASVAINAAGTGYTAGDILTVAGGTFSKAARILVLTIGGGGAIATHRMYDSGAYTVDPSLTANAVTGGTGTTATFNITMEHDRWTVDLDSTIFSTEKVKVWHSSQGAYVGLRTYQEDTGARHARNWALFGLSGYNGALPWYQQPDLTPNLGFSYTTGAMSTNQNGIYAVFKASDTYLMDYWFYVTNRRIIVIAKLYDNVTTTPRYSSLYMGFLNPMGTSSEFPYPLFIAGSSGWSKQAWDDLAPAFSFSGIGQLNGPSNATGAGPAGYFDIDGNWKDCKNFGHSTFNVNSRSISKTCGTYPGSRMDATARSGHQPINIDTASVYMQWNNIIQDSSFAAATFELWPTPDTGGEKRLLVPNVLFVSNAAIPADFHLAGEVDGVYWASASGSTTATSEDLIVDAASGNWFTFFQNGYYSQLDGFMLIRES